MDKKCEYFEIYEIPNTIEPFGPDMFTYKVCLGTGNKEQCTCNGNLSNCDFYPEKRKTANAELLLEKINKSIEFLKEQGYKVIKEF